MVPRKPICLRARAPESFLPDPFAPNGSLFDFEELKTIKAQPQTISKLDRGVNRHNVSFQRTTNEKSWTKNNYKRFRSSISKVNGSPFVFQELQTIKAQLQTISKLELDEKWVLVRFRGTTNDKKKLQTISKLDLGVKWLNLNFWRTTHEKK